MELYMRRGELYLQHEEYEFAIHDFTKCLGHAFQNSRVYLGLGESFLHSGKTDDALLYLNLIPDTDPEYLSGLQLKSNALAREGHYCEAANGKEAVILRLISRRYLSTDQNAFNTEMISSPCLATFWSPNPFT